MNLKTLLLALAMASVPQVTPAVVITVTNVDNYLLDGVTVAQGSLLEALQVIGDGDTIRFDIPGTGPQIIATPPEGYPFITNNNVTIDGYSQPGAVPNTNPILGGNNARIKIVLDSSAGPDQRTLLGPLGNPGFGDSESAMLALLGAKNCTIKGLSFLSRYTDDSDTDPDIYCVALINDATGARLQGCWFGLAPDGVQVAAGLSAVAAFRGDGGTTADGLIFGTDGDGVNDVAEFNLSIGMVLAINLQTPGVKVSGNYINVFPNGVTFFDVDALAFNLGTTVESIENGSGHNMIIGTDGDGVSDANERNIFAHSVYDRTVEFWGDHATNVIIAGNYFGVGVDGHTPAPVPTNASPDFVQVKDHGSIRIGSNGDGVSDTLEGNLFYNFPGTKFIDATGSQGAGTITQIVVRRNQFKNCKFPAIPFADSAVSYASYYTGVVTDPTLAVPVLQQMFGGVLNGSFVPPDGVNYTTAIIDLYAVDPAGLSSRLYWPVPMVHPSTWLGGYKDNGPFDLDPTPNQFAINVSTLGLAPGTYVAVAVTYSTQDRLFNADQAITGPMSNPLASRPTLLMSYLPDLQQLELSWLAQPNGFGVQASEALVGSDWLRIPGDSYSGGRNILQTQMDPFSPIQFYRLISQ